MENAPTCAGAHVTAANHNRLGARAAQSPQGEKGAAERAALGAETEFP